MEPREKPFVLSSLRIHNRVLRTSLRFDPAKMPPGRYPVGLLCVYCGREDFDLRLIGDVSGRGYGAADPLLGSHIVASTLHNLESETLEEGYLGAWWYGRMEDVDWNQKRQMGMHLADLAGAGRMRPIEGGGYLLAAIVAGRIGHGNLVLLSNVLTQPYEPDAPAPETTPPPQNPGAAAPAETPSASRPPHTPPGAQPAS